MGNNALKDERKDNKKGKQVKIRNVERGKRRKLQTIRSDKKSKEASYRFFFPLER
jgi:hypothetical protein